MWYTCLMWGVSGDFRVPDELPHRDALIFGLRLLFAVLFAAIALCIVIFAVRVVYIALDLVMPNIKAQSSAVADLEASTRRMRRIWNSSALLHLCDGAGPL